MKNIFLLLTCLCLSLSGFSQGSLTGDWTMEVPGKDGGMVPLKLSIAEGGTYTVDFGMDGEIEVHGQYELADNQITIWDTDGDGAGCGDAKGVYTFEATDASLTMTRVSDACETQRRARWRDDYVEDVITIF